MATLGDLMAALGVRRGPLDMVPREPAARVSPDGQLDIGAIMAGARVGQTAKSQYEPTLRPGEKRTPEELQAMLWNVVQSAGMESLPGIGPHKLAKQAPGRVRPGHEKQFAEWFSGSTTVDAEGKPQTFYHGTHAGEFNAFRPGTGSSRLIADKVGSHFGTASAANRRLGQAPDGPDAPTRIIPVHLRVTRPLTKRDGSPLGESEMRAKLNAIAKQAGVDPARRPVDAALTARRVLMEQGYDGIAYRNSVEDRGSTSYVVFSGEQIKSATGNRGTYSRSSGDIRE
jgi:hypothetical protein